MRIVRGWYGSESEHGRMGMMVWGWRDGSGEEWDEDKWDGGHEVDVMGWQRE